MAQDRFFAQNKGPTLEDILIRMLDLIEPKEKEKALKDILSDLKLLDFTKIEKRERICLIDSAIKFGSIELVKTITEKFISLGFSEDIARPYEGHGEHLYRPVFWLAAVATKQPNIPEENYTVIENYLCTKFNIPNAVMINGSLITRDQYIKEVTKWKQAKNEELTNLGRINNRYTI